MLPEFQRLLGRLRRKLAIAGFAQGLFWGLGLCAAIGVIALVADRFVVVPRLPRVVIVAVVTVTAAVIAWEGMRRRRRPDAYLAQWIDIENGLQDMFSSAFEFSLSAAADPWRRSCIATSVVLVQQRPIRLPRVGIGRISPPFVAMIFFAVTIGLSFVISRRKPEVDAKSTVRLDPALAASTRERINSTGAEAAKLGDREAQELARALDTLIRQSDTASIRKEQFLKELAGIRHQLDQSGGGSGGNGPSLVGSPQLSMNSALQSAAAALKAGDLEAGASALTEAASALQSGKLSEDEVQVLTSLVQYLGQLESTSGAKSGGAWGSTVEALSQGNRAVAAKLMGEAAPKLQTELGNVMSRRSMYREIAKTLQQLERGMHATTIDAAEGKPPAEPADRKLGQSPGPAGQARTGEAGFQGMSGKGGQASGRDQRIEEKVTPASTARDVHIVGEWSGKTIREIVAGTSLGASEPVLADVVRAHERVAEASLDRDEIPEDYQVAIRNYFEAIRLAGEGAWKPTSK